MVERPFTSSLCREIHYSAKCAWLLVRESGFLARLMVVGNSLILASWAICRDAGTFCEHGHKSLLQEFSQGWKDPVPTPHWPCGPTPLSDRGQDSPLSDLMQQHVPSWIRNREPALPSLTER